ncbi:MAG: PstS family phosphate ABC transporter substrate-binding protein [Solirubrobacterales bacterium]
MLRIGRDKSARAGIRAALLAGATVLVVAFSGGSASASVSCTGSNIIGQGSSLQKIAQQNVWAPAFAGEICNKGSFPTVTYESTGSGAGLKQWNSDGSLGSINTERQFIGTDDAPTEAQISNMTSVAGGAALVVVPVAQTAIAIVANPPAGCTVEAITNKDLEQIFRGNVLKWSKVATAEGGAACEQPITRVVRKDGSGTTYQFKNYLYKTNQNKLACTTGNTEGKATWQELEPITNGETGAPNTVWAETCTVSGVTTHLSPVVRPGSNGGGAVVQTVNATAGSIGYASLPDAKSNSAADILAVQNNGSKPLLEATFASPALGGEANCLETAYTVPVNSRNQEGSTGLNVDWSQVFGAQPSTGGTRYPLCTLTYDLAWHGYGAAGFTRANKVTVYDYLREFILFKGQETLANSGTFYAPLPATGGNAKNVLNAAKFAAGKITF